MDPLYYFVGRYFTGKYRHRLADTGDTQAVARQLRKQGVPLTVALLVLVGRV